MFDSLKKKLDSFIGQAEEKAQKQEEPEEPEEKESDESVKLSAGSRIKGAITRKVKLTEKDLEDTLWDLQMGLIQNDVAMETAKLITERLKKKLVSKEVPKDELDSYIRDSIKKTLVSVLTPGRRLSLIENIEDSDDPQVILFLGVNGTGKTTTIAKFAHLLQKRDFSVVLVAGDTFRAGAIEQLTEHANELGVKLIKHQKGADSAAVVYDAIQHAKSKGLDAVLVDTAGRMQTNQNLMDELRKICRVNDPDFRIFVGDALTGNDAVDQARDFHEAVGVDGVILTKLDSDAKGGSALSIANEIKRPIVYVGVGQSFDDLMEFDPEWFVDQVI